MIRMFKDVLVAFQFLTRLPTPKIEYEPDALARAACFFPLVGIGVGVSAYLVHYLLMDHLPKTVIAIVVLLLTVLITGALHEDGFADAADGFGGGWNREQVLLILKDSRIGSFGALAIVFSFGARLVLLAQLPERRFAAFIICAHMLCRWTALPLGYFLQPARVEIGQGSRLGGKLSFARTMFSTLLTFTVAIYFFRFQFWIPMLVATAITAISGFYYKRRIGGITGDCFGATNQLTEIAIYLCGVWH
jgi:adenosylcobinamide-GDP ribazoletransferase